MANKKKKYIHRDCLGRELKVGDLIITHYYNDRYLRRIKCLRRKKLDWIKYVNRNGIETRQTVYSGSVIKVEETDEIKLYLKLGLYPNWEGIWEENRWGEKVI